LLQRSIRIKTQTKGRIAFYTKVTEKEIASEREREREGNEDRKRMVKGTSTSLLEIIATVVCESTE
jgi:hypothetical protein